MKKLVAIGACLAIGSVMTLGVFVPNAHAARGTKVDCSQVMQELKTKKPKEVAADMKISVSSVYRCRRRAHETTGGGTAHGMTAHPMASPSPAAAAH